jgi:hypothetical protein
MLNFSCKIISPIKKFFNKIIDEEAKRVDEFNRNIFEDKPNEEVKD